MSSTPANINIDISDKCDLKCRLILEYPGEGINILSINYNGDFKGIVSNDLGFNSPNANIKYNNTSKQLESIHIVKPSLHTYANRRIDAELILNHGDVLICIPVISKSYSGILDEILVGVEEGTDPNLKLDNVVPKKPFYAYKGGIGGNNDRNIIVFRKMDALSINEKRLNALKSHDRSETFEVNENDKISYNKNGPENNDIDQAFPITCEPILGVDYVEEKKKAKSPFTMSEADLNEWGNKAIVQIIVGMIIIFFLYSLFNFIFKRTNKIASSASDPVGSTEFK